MTSSSTPDISSLTLSPQRSQQRPNENYETYDGRNPYHYQTSPPIIPGGQNPFNTTQATPSPLKNKGARAGLPSQWLDSSAIASDPRPLSPPQSSDISSVDGSPSMSSQLPSQGGQAATGDDEIIPTAIVIKNIPFNVKRETLLDIIVSLNIPTPYAFNYHLDQAGSFRGLAFANFRLSQDADAVVAALNGFDVQGRKLRVEYKKVLQAGEKERIEREKAIRRMRSMQLEKEQQAQQQQQQQSFDEFGPIVTPTLTPSRSFSAGMGMYQPPYSPPQVPPIPSPQPSFASASPPHAPAQPQAQQPPVATPAKSSTELDLNDPSTLDIYSRILLFKDDHMRDELAFSRTLSAKQRRVVHLVAQKLGVYHYSVGEGDERYAVVTRVEPPGQGRPAAQRVASQTFSRAPTSYLSPTPSMDQSSNGLRSKKSMPDMKTLHTSAPRLSTRSSNGNIREGYATIASPSRRSPGGFGALFGSGGAFGNLGSIPPVPSLPAVINGGGGGGASDGPNSGVVRQPRGPSGVGGFNSRRDRTAASDVALAASRGLEARSHEPLEI
ncbi:hypothetical protein BU17DRAFT_75912 [Hysterangium stoloniferum]|nr:hypothetical protein BU17DRAFT_75912 [Hysterangium stoloniferum]